MDVPAIAPYIAVIAVQVAIAPMHLFALALGRSIVSAAHVLVQLPLIVPNGSLIMTNVGSVAAAVAVITISIVTPAVGVSPIAIIFPTPALCH